MGEAQPDVVVASHEPVQPVPVPVVVPSVVSEPKPATQARSGSGCEKYRDIISQYSWNVEVAIKVCNAESGGNSHIANMNDYHSFAHCRGSFGLFQINCSHGRVYDPTENVRIAYQMYQARKWAPWSFTTCRYKVKCY